MTSNGYTCRQIAYKCFYLYSYTPPGRRHPSFHVRGPVLTLRLSFPSVSGKVWNVALAQESESPPLPLSAPASQRKKKKKTQRLSRRDVKANIWTPRQQQQPPISASHASRKTVLINTPHAHTHSSTQTAAPLHTHTQLVLIWIWIWKSKEWPKHTHIHTHTQTGESVNGQGRWS